MQMAYAAAARRDLAPLICRYLRSPKESNMPLGGTEAGLADS